MKRLVALILSFAALSYSLTAQITQGELKIPPGGLPNVTHLQKEQVKNSFGLIISQNFRVSRMGRFLDDGWFEKSKDQEGIIGNDYSGPEQIGLAVAENSYGTSSDYVPVDGWKRCFCGSIKNYYFRDPGPGGSDDDLNILIQATDNNSLINQQNNRLRSLLGPEYPANKFHIYGEIDIADGSKSNFTKQGDPDLYLPNNFRYLIGKKVCIYGAWVVEKDGVIDEDGILGTGVGEDLRHGNYHEVHPADQVWYRTVDTYSPKIRYVLTGSVDNSGRFNSYSEFENGNPKQLWSKSPKDFVFVIPFEIRKLWKEKMIFTIRDQSKLNAKATTYDGPKHYLLYKNDTLAEVREETTSELVTIDLQNVGYVVSNARDTFYRGYLVIKSSVKDPEIPLLPEGHVKLIVNAVRTTPLTQKIRVWVESIERLEDNSFRERGEGEFGPYLLTNPKPVPSDFNEKKVTVQLSYKQNRMPAIDIPVLEKGQSKTFNDYYAELEVPVNANYYEGVTITCKTKYNQQTFELGDIMLTDKLKNGASVALTRIAYESNQNLKQVNDPQTGDEGTQPSGNPPVGRYAQLFKITFRTELLTIRAEDPGRN